MPFRCGLVAYDAQKLLEISSQRVCQWLVVMGVIGNGITVCIGERPYTVRFQLYIQVRHSKCIYIFYTNLQSVAEQKHFPTLKYKQSMFPGGRR